MDNRLVLYHGTDARFVRMSDADRNAYIDNCREAINYMWPFYQHMLEKDPSLEELSDLMDDVMAHNVSEAILVYRSSVNGSGQYQYGDLYLTSDLRTAIDYAASSYVGGEFCRLAFRMYQGSQLLLFDGWNPNRKLLETFNKMIEFDSEQHEPIILKFEELDTDYLLLDDGEIPNTDDLKYASLFRYTKRLEFNLSKALFLPHETFKKAWVGQALAELPPQ